MTAETLKTFIALPSSGSTYSKSKRNVNLITICLSTVFSLICLTLLGILIFNSMRINVLQKDLDSLKKALDGMHKRLGLDYFDDLNDFEDLYSNNLNDPHGDLLDSFEDEDEEEDELDMEEDGSGEFDDENYDDLDDDLNLDDYRPYEETFKRTQRSIATHPGQSTHQEPLFENKNDLKISKQSNEEDYQHLTIDDEDKVDISDSVPTRRKHLKSKDRRRSYRRYYKRHFEPRYLVKRRSSNNRLLRNGGRSEDGFLQQSNFAALHYILNGTNTGLGESPPHFANTRLRHDGDVYVGHVNPWSKENGFDKPFDIEKGYVRITESGIYLIYAQVYYHNHMDRNGFFVYHNSHAFLQCALTVPENISKGNTCYTSGVTYLEKNDVIHLRDIYRERSVNFNGRSFLGIIKLSETK